MNRLLLFIDLIYYYFFIVLVYDSAVCELLLAHLWGAYAIPMALSVVRHSSYVVRRVSSVSTITTRNH